MAILQAVLAFSRAHMTWTKGGNEIEDRLTDLWEQMRSADRGFLTGEGRARLQAIENDLPETGVSYEEWEVLFRTQMLLGCARLQTLAGITDRPTEMVETTEERSAGMAAVSGTCRPATGLFPRAAGVAFLALFTLLGVRGRPPAGA